MDLEHIEDIIEKENINLIDTYLEDTEGAYVSYNKLKLIMYDNSKLNSSIRKKQILAKELGHYYYDATYKFNSDLYFISKQEYKSDKWAYNTLIPFENLKLAIKSRK